MTASSRPACTSDPDAWDLDQVDLPGALRAVRACHTCPLFAACYQDLLQQYPGDAGPTGLVQAGIAFDNTGSRLSGPTLAAWYSRIQAQQMAAA